MVSENVLSQTTAEQALKKKGETDFELSVIKDAKAQS